MNDIICLYKMSFKNNKKQENSENNFETCLSISFDGKYFITGTNYGIINIYDFHSNVYIKSINVYADYIISCRFSPKGKYIIVVSSNIGIIDIYDFVSGKLIKKIIDNNNIIVSSIIVSNDEKTIAYAGVYDDYIYIFDIATDYTRKIKIYEKNIQKILLSWDGIYIIILTNKKICIYEFYSGIYINSTILNDRLINCISLSRDCKKIICAGKNIDIYEYESLKLIKSIKISKKIISLLCMLDSNNIIFAAADNTIQIYDLINEKPIKVINIAINLLCDIIISPDEKNFIVSSIDNIYKYNIVLPGK